VNDRSRLGDWAGDLIVGPMSRSAVATLVERRSVLLRLVHLRDGHCSALTDQAKQRPRQCQAT
jgi:IS30 family transposase